MLGTIVLAIISVLFIIGGMSILIDVFTSSNFQHQDFESTQPEIKSNYVYITEEDIVLAEPLLDDLDLEIDADLLE